MRHPVSTRKAESGQAVVVVVLAMAIFLIGAIGLALDASTLYAQRQMAQAAADAGATAGIISVFDGTNTSGTHKFSTSSGFTCATSDAETPCYYAQTLNGFNGASDTVAVDFPSASTAGVPSGSLWGGGTNLLRVIVSRQVSVTLLGFLGFSSQTVKASATGAIVNVTSPIPIIITHPTMAGALSMNGNTSITITGGPQRSIQVNSDGASGAAYSGPSSGEIDLSGAGPNGTGGDFGTFGGPSGAGCGAPPALCNSVSPGTTGHYLDPASPIQDPLAGISPPSVPSTTPPQSGQSCSTLGHCSSCPGGASTCTEYLPGLYNSGNGINIKNSTAMFDPGIYYIQGGGFTTKNSTVGMCTGCASDPTTVNGMLVYDTGTTSNPTATGGFTIDTNSNDVFYGAGISASSPTAAPAGPYYGILFFEDRNANAQTHTLGQGNGCFSVYGTIYITNTLSIMTSNASHYQTVDYHGTPCSNTENFGEIIVSQLTVKGTAGINMGLFKQALFTIRQVALVQ